MCGWCSTPPATSPTCPSRPSTASRCRASPPTVGGAGRDRRARPGVGWGGVGWGGVGWRAARSRQHSAASCPWAGGVLSPGGARSNPVPWRDQGQTPFLAPALLCAAAQARLSPPPRCSRGCRPTRPSPWAWMCRSHGAWVAPLGSPMGSYATAAPWPARMRAQRPAWARAPAGHACCPANQPRAASCPAAQQCMGASSPSGCGGQTLEHRMHACIMHSHACIDAHTPCSMPASPPPCVPHPAPETPATALDFNSGWWSPPSRPTTWTTCVWRSWGRQSRWRRSLSWRR